MDTIIRITAAVRFSGGSLKELKQQWQAAGGQDGRRMSRLSLLAALGAAQLRHQAAVRADCAVYLATPFASPALFDKMADNVLNHAAAMPFDFMANLHNAPAFHAAQALGAQGATLVLAADGRPQSWTNILRLAANALHAGNAQIAVGFAHERRDENEADGSVWLLLEASATHGRALDWEALPRESRPSESAYWQGLEDWLFEAV